MKGQEGGQLRRLIIWAAFLPMVPPSVTRLIPQVKMAWGTKSSPRTSQEPRH